MVDKENWSERFGDVYVGTDSLIRQGRAAARRYPHLGRTSYDRPVSIVTLEDVICAPGGIYLPDLGRWIWESTLAGNLEHRAGRDLDMLLRAAGQTLAPLPDDLSLPAHDGDLFWGRYPWDSNYQHFFVETLPRIFLAHSYLPEPVPLRFAVSDRGFIPDCLAKIGLGAHRLLTADDLGAGRRVARVHLAVPVYVNMLGLNSTLMRDCIETMMLGAPPRPRGMAEHADVYVGRRATADNHGAGRVLLNEAEVGAALGARGYDTFYMEELSIDDKIHRLARTRRVVMPIGAGLVNLAVARQLEHLLILQHPFVNLPAAWFERYLRQFSSCRVSVLEVTVAGDLPEGQRQHAPFTAAPQDIARILDTWEG